jgi:phosphomannomutase
VRDRLRRFAVVGLIATVVDVGLLVQLLEWGWPVVAADVVALAVAALVARRLHRLVTLRDDPFARWIRIRRVFVAVVVVAGLVDLTVLAVIGTPGGPGRDLAAKVVAVAAAAGVRGIAYRAFLFRVIRREQDSPSDRSPAAGAFRVSVVLPAYSEADRISVAVTRVRRELGEALGRDGEVEPVEVIVVDDGSPDETAQRAEAAGADRVVRLERNSGKGAAVRAGVAVATGRTVVFTDADLAYGPAQAAALVLQVEAGYDMVVGSRRHTDTRTLVRTGRIREVGGRLVNLATHALLLGQYRDTQCGLKAFRADVAHRLFEASTLDGFAFDVELFHLAERWRLTLAEVPVEVENSERTTVRALRDGFRLVVDLVRVRQLARRGGYPAPAVDPSTAGSRPVASAAGPATEGRGQVDPAAVGAVFKAYDIRGRVPEELDESLAGAIGRAFALLVRDEEPDTTRVVVGRDMRPSGTLLGAAFASGVMSEGLDVVDLGLASTDMLYYASGNLGVPGAVLTASHNPAGYNGMKLCLSAARPVGGDTGLDRMAARILAGFDGLVAVGDGSTTSLDVLSAFVEHVRSFVDLDSLRPLRVVVDTANGMGGLVVPAVFDGLPFHLDHLFAELDGTFPNHPADPIQPENLRDLQARVLETGADIGLAFDGDADRVFLVDEQARPVSGSTTTALVASGVLRREPGATVLHNLICSKAVPEVIAECGGRAVRTRVGHSIIKQAMVEEGAVFAGEHSGHYYFRDNYRADSGLIAALVVLEALSASDLPLSGLLAPFDRYAASGEMNTTVADPAAVIEFVAGHYPDEAQDRLDGLTVDFGDWWFNLRPSNTEPLLRLNVEAADDDACAARAAEVQALIDQ